MAKKKQHVPMEESIEEQQERQRLNLSIVEMRLTIMLKEVTPENAPERIAAFESSADIPEDYKQWIVNVIQKMTESPKPFPIDRGLLLDMRREISDLVRDARKIKYDLEHPPVSLDDMKSGLRTLASHLFDNFSAYLNLDERREGIASYVIYQVRAAFGRRDIGILSDAIEGLSKEFNSLLLRIEEEINLLAAKEQMRHLVADMRERLRDEASAVLTDKEMNSEGNGSPVGTLKVENPGTVETQGLRQEGTAAGALKDGTVGNEFTPKMKCVKLYKLTIRQLDRIIKDYDVPTVPRGKRRTFVHAEKLRLAMEDEIDRPVVLNEGTIETLKATVRRQRE